VAPTATTFNSFSAGNTRFLTNVLEIMDSAILRSEERAKLVVEFLLQDLVQDLVQDLLQDLGRPLAGLERLQEAVIRKLRDWDAETASRDRTLVLQNV